MSRTPSLVAAVALAVLVPAASHTSAGAAPATAPATIEVVAESADAIKPAVRLGPTAPVNFPMDPSPRCYILDNFGDARSGGRRHQGSDMLATLGQKVFAMADGVLTDQAIDGTSGASLSGNLWDLTAADKTVYVYAHLSGFAPGLTVGSRVFKGQVLGYVGDTGNPGPGNYHLHFELHPKGGSPVNPLPYLTIPPTCSVT